MTSFTNKYGLVIVYANKTRTSIWQCGEVKVYAALLLNKRGKAGAKKSRETTKNGFNRGAKNITHP